MLQLIRDKAQGIIIWIIVGLVILALSSFILNSYLGSSVKTYVAKVNDQTITQRDYQMAFNSYEQRMRQMLGKNFAKFYNEKMMRQTVIENLVSNAMMQQLTKAAGFRTSDQQVANVIKNTPAFQQGGKFSQKHYKDLLARVGYTPSQYESDISHDQSQQQFENGLSGSAFILKSQAQDYLQLELQQRNVDYLLISMPALRKNISISDKDIKEYYDSHLSAFMTEEQVQVSYLNLDKQALAQKVKVSDAELKAYYNNHKASYTSDDYAAAKKKIEDIAARIRKGASFAEMAKKYSQDPGSARKGGDLGFFSKGMMVKPFQEAAFKLKIGQISKPIRTKFGYHLIKLIAIRDDGKQRRVRHILIKPEKVVQPFAKVKSQIVRAVQLQHADKIFYQDADKLDRLSYEYQDSLDPAAEKLNAKIQVSPLFARQGGAGIWGNPDVIKAAFSDDVLKGGLNSDLIKISDDHMLVLRLKQHKPATQKPLAEVKQQIETLLKKQRASAEAAKLASKYVTEIKKGEKPDKLASANMAVSWTQAGYIGRKSQYDANQNDKVRVPAEIRKQAFLIGKPQDKQPAVDSEQLANGDAAVIILSAIRDKPENKDNKQVTAVQQQLLESEYRVQRSLLLQYQRAHSKVDIVKEKDSDQDS